jgi:hypothetical protein
VFLSAVAILDERDDVVSDVESRSGRGDNELDMLRFEKTPA